MTLSMIKEGSYFTQFIRKEEGLINTTTSHQEGGLWDILVSVESEGLQEKRDIVGLLC